MVPTLASAYMLTPNFSSNKSFQNEEASQTLLCSSDKKIKAHFPNKRREIIALVGMMAAPYIKPKRTDALQPKNEDLCGTGFFENFQEYRCTAIGDISDEGLSKDMNSNEKELAGSLMGKLGVSTNDLKMELNTDDKSKLSFLRVQEPKPEKK